MHNQRGGGDKEKRNSDQSGNRENDSRAKKIKVCKNYIYMKS